SGSACAVPWRPASVLVLAGRLGRGFVLLRRGVVAGGLVLRLEGHVHASAAGRGAALHLAGRHVVDDPLAGDAAAPRLLDHGVAAEDDGVAVLVVVDPGRGGVHPATVVHLLLHLHRRAGELDHLLVAAAADIGLRRLDVERALGDVHAARQNAWLGLVDRAVRTVG